MDQCAVPVEADHRLQGVGAAFRADDIAGNVVTNPGMEPGGVPSQTPTRFVRSNAFRLVEMLLDLGIGGTQPSAGTEHDLGTGTTCHPDAEES